MPTGYQFSCGTVDGIFALYNGHNSNTRVGVMAYQNMKLLTSDGAVGSNTWTQLAYDRAFSETGKSVAMFP